jgi:general nucleoside transport system ATP-binding protein
VSTAPSLVELSGITKTYGTLVANDGIDLTVEPGEVHALLGENGAGKSTLTRILYGLSLPDAGTIRIDGATQRFRSPADARAAGVGMVTQEFSLVDTMTVAENVVLAGVGYGRVRLAAHRARVVALLERLGTRTDPGRTVGELSVGEKQRVEIAKALFHDCRVLILDEPTAVLTPQDSEHLFAAVRELTSTGLGVIFISHKLGEVVQVADRVSVLRRGRLVATLPAEGLDRRRIAELMIGDRAAAPLIDTETAGRTDRATTVGGPPALEVRGLTAGDPDHPALRGVDLVVRHGEIVGIAGVSGNGQTELVKALAATLQPIAGEILVNGRDVTALPPAARLAAGLARLSEDRRGSVIPGMTVAENLALEDPSRVVRRGILSRRALHREAERLIREFDIRARPRDPIQSLSGGNLQKVLLARAIGRRPDALVVAQPTRGLDVGAAAFVYEQLERLRAERSGVLLVSEDLDELLRLADRLLVMYGGRVVGEVPSTEATSERLGVLMAGEAA